MKYELIQIENTLKAVYQIRENAQFHEDGVSLQQLGEQRNLPLSEVKKEVKRRLLTVGRYSNCSAQSYEKGLSESN